LQAYPDAASESDDNGDWLPIHMAAEFPSDVRVIRALLDTYPDGAAKCDKSHRLPLHIALKYDAVIEVIQALVDVNPNAARLEEEHGRLPLHVAAKFQAGDVVDVVLRAYPDAASESDNYGCVPAHYLRSGDVCCQLASACPMSMLHRNNEGVSPLMAWLQDESFAEDIRNSIVQQVLISCGSSLKASANSGEKASWFVGCIRDFQDAAGRLPPPVSVVVQRGHVLEGLCGALQHQQDLLGGLAVQLDGENGEGDGVVREVMSLMVAELCNSDNALFERGADKERRIHPSVKSSVQLDHLSYFELVGKLIGVSLSGRGCFPADLSIPVLKQFLDQSLTVEDLRGTDSQLYANVVTYHRAMKEDDLRSQGITFTYEEEKFGSITFVDLLGCGGEEEIVETRRDLEKYLKVLAHYMMIRRVEKQISAMKQGLCSVVPIALLTAASKCFSAEEFGDLIGGPIGFSSAAVDNWQNNTRYEGYNAVDSTIIIFWMVVRFRFDPMQRSALLRFVHGCARMPPQGFGHLRGCDSDVILFTVARVETPSESSEERLSYPRAQTCFNRLWLPAYQTEDEMERRLLAVLTDEAGGFDEAAAAG